MRMTKRKYGMMIIGLGLGLLGDMTLAHAGSQSGIEVKAAWVRDMPPNVKNTAAYMTLHNHGSEADRLIGVQSPIAAVAELHKVVRKDGMMSMRPVDHIAVVEKGSTTLKPGGFHIMLINLKEPPKLGEHVSLTLTFERAGEVELMIPVQAGPKAVMKHHHHMTSSSHDKKH